MIVLLVNGHEQLTTPCKMAFATSRKEPSRISLRANLACTPLFTMVVHLDETNRRGE
jgi:hypothetical protein